MGLLKDNLLSYEQEMGLSSADIAELSELPIDSISKMESGKFYLEDAKKLCTKLNISFSSMYSDTGFERTPILEQYGGYPSQLRHMITKRFYRELKDRIQPKEFNEAMPVHYAVAGKFNTGSASMSVANLKDLRRNLADSQKVMKKDDFDELLSDVSYSLIPNYNYYIAKNHFCISYSQIAKYMGVKDSTAASWGGLTCNTISSTYIPILVKLFGNINEFKFQTCPLTTKYFSGRTCDLDLEDKQKSNKKGEEQGERGRSERTAFELKLPDPPADDTEMKIVPQIKEKQLPSTNLKIEVTEERLMKMYNSISPEHRALIDKMIVEFFLDDM